MTLPHLPVSPEQSRWFYATPDGEPQGPISLAELRRLASHGVLSPDSFVIQEGGTEWRKVSDVVGDFAISPAHWLNRVKQWNPHRLLLILFSFLGMIATFMPWVKAPIFGRTLSVSGADRNNWETFFLFLVAGVIAAVGDRTRPLSRNGRWATGALGGLAMLCGLWAIHWVATSGDKDTDDYAINWVGFGLYVIVIAGAAIVAIAYRYAGANESGVPGPPFDFRAFAADAVPKIKAAFSRALSFCRHHINHSRRVVIAVCLGLVLLVNVPALWRGASKLFQSVTTSGKSSDTGGRGSKGSSSSDNNDPIPFFPITLTDFHSSLKEQAAALPDSGIYISEIQFRRVGDYQVASIYVLDRVRIDIPRLKDIDEIGFIVIEEGGEMPMHEKHEATTLIVKTLAPSIPLKRIDESIQRLKARIGTDHSEQTEVLSPIRLRMRLTTPSQHFTLSVHLD